VLENLPKISQISSSSSFLDTPKKNNKYQFLKKRKLYQDRQDNKFLRPSFTNKKFKFEKEIIFVAICAIHCVRFAR
jgi:hypothetical protein